MPEHLKEIEFETSLMHADNKAKIFIESRKHTGTKPTLQPLPRYDDISNYMTMLKRKSIKLKQSYHLGKDILHIDGCKQTMHFLLASFMGIVSRMIWKDGL